MPRKKGTTYVVDAAWRKRVEGRLAELGWRRADLARESGCSRSTISEVLNGDTNELMRLPEIHKVLGFEPPMPPMLSKDAGELMYLWERLDDVEKGRLLERARVIWEGKRPK